MSTGMKDAAATATSASALGAKTARACDSCLRRRARWFCAADDAFLCHACDNLVHSANQLASRHERVRLQTASCKLTNKVTTAHAWHSGFTRKARTPRHNNNKHLALQQRLKDQVLFNTACVLPVVPELGVEETALLDDHESEEQLLCRVPVFDPFDAELCNDVYSEVRDEKNHEERGCCDDLESFSEFLPSDMDLAEFAADVENLLGSGIDEDSLGIDCKEEVQREDACVRAETTINIKEGAMVMVKVKDEELDSDTASHLQSVFDITNDDEFDWNIESVLLSTEEKATAAAPVSNNSDSVSEEKKRDIFLRLNYEEVINAWASQGSPWTTGTPPPFNPHDHSWPNFLDPSGGDVHQCSSYGDGRSVRGHVGDGGREARVSRYREKRRTRLFAKKIRYEVRKLNAEKRPRMKGRFVKRSCLVGGATTSFQTSYN
ncbi:hypothetical protein HN51_035863 [Arachis hypogaea]|uniref:Zinc finger protein CONSTANS-LIKE 16 n=1 Tax=Arachis hypogaea TaxID=3818 RepID=A0A445A2P3_ARAHY|nr:zinc finger protein CONSTANS-LIKE 16 [Arachis ipaensis]XP_025644245.1 zinc finger protein CONSTANS-LIKE 16 [Arachis hypogaea]QHO01090.1 Zinc finger protein CONSTANS-LIKE [Arachis hypogaea]RYR20687.1 hypothetical protein Ahy_B03g065903 [Arachis hypogaea]